MKRIFSLGPMVAVRVPVDVAQHAGLVLGDKVVGSVRGGRIVYEKGVTGRTVSYRAKDFGLAIIPIPNACQRELGLEVGDMVDVVVRGGLLTLVPAA